MAEKNNINIFQLLTWQEALTINSHSKIRPNICKIPCSDSFYSKERNDMDKNFFAPYICMKNHKIENHKCAKTNLKVNRDRILNKNCFRRSCTLCSSLLYSYKWMYSTHDAVSKFCFNLTSTHIYGIHLRMATETFVLDILIVFTLSLLKLRPTKKQIS